MIKIIKKKNDWCPLIRSSKNSDFYHTYDYHHLSKNKEELPVLITYSESDKTISLPLLLRKIEGTPFFDATSVYGYSGPTIKNIPTDFDNSVFKEELNRIFQELKIISVFSRLNPFVEHQNSVLTGLGDLSMSGKVIYIDLTKDLDTQKSAYDKRLRTYINKARRQCGLRLAEGPEDLDIFIEMYYENMKRVNAKKSYFFSKKYFVDLLKTKDFETEILLATHDESKKIIGGAMFIKKNKIVQYHLSGAKEEYLALNAIKLIIDEMRIRATQEGYKYLNLGGGVGGQEDSLFHFKSKFSKDYKDFELWKYVVNQKVYDDLVTQVIGQESSSLRFKAYTKYFPFYRCNSNELKAINL
ncbi:GNAT family N-acetyltransferase [Maribacter polysiphoniae]|uniref:Acetyltransferase (GNAT) family protein n=1 Tax=Maribacter polysiphoniae TaxID=429344 RepID=A0A316DS27_9FLAO|nr:GNAT family N-acetyltransferase [Maribacter polysiphoniae]MBD1262699.1 GNAT family N-acetyltransferase [Maribacter polysiphoniae]PWK21097.1 acetyltransferase (GNAT) family protein [Maribacter polysiphoniae]